MDQQAQLLNAPLKTITDLDLDVLIQLQWTVYNLLGQSDQLVVQRVDEGLRLDLDQSSLSQQMVELRAKHELNLERAILIRV